MYLTRTGNSDSLAILRRSDIHPKFRIYTIYILRYYAKYFYGVHSLWTNYVIPI